MKTHDLEFFYRYVTTDVAIKILETQKVLCSAPECFNDPFDSQLPIQFDCLNEETLKDRLSIALFNKLYSLGIPSHTLTEEEKKETLQVVNVSETLKNACSDFNRIIKTEFDSDRIFCFSEVFDNLLMWAHYSDGHKGAVIRFKCLPGNYAFNAAQKVNYSREIPKLKIEELVEDYFSNKQDVIKRIITEILLTKSIDWEYEKEWRIILQQQDQRTKQDLRRHDPKEIDGVYLGCKMLPENEEKIKNIIRSRLTHVKLYKAEKSDSEFKLNFSEIKTL